MVTQLWQKFKHLFEKILHLSVVGCLIVLFEQLFEYLPQGCTAVKMKAGENDERSYIYYRL
jgi:hypothetical protein